jgi:D-Tyr-tRNAtyr deacylase
MGMAKASLLCKVNCTLMADIEQGMRTSWRMASCCKTLKRLNFRQYKDMWVQKRQDGKILIK